jgi:hypothetical protein
MQAVGASSNRRRFCPRCGRNDIAKSHSGVIEQQVLRMLHLRAYRCCECGRRFYGRRPLLFVELKRASYKLTTDFILELPGLCHGRAFGLVGL